MFELLKLTHEEKKNLNKAVTIKGTNVMVKGLHQVHAYGTFVGRCMHGVSCLQGPCSWFNALQAAILKLIVCFFNKELLIFLAYWTLQCM